MTIVKHELKQGFKALIIWAFSIGALLSVSVMLFPEMKGQMAQAGDMFASMGSFSEAFGMDKLDFSVFSGYYAVECANVLGLAGAFYAALCAIGALSREEGGRTAEFLLTHPITRASVISQKLLSVFFRVTLLNVFIFALSLTSAALIGEQIPWKEFALLHCAFYLMQLELTGICFGISTFICTGSLAIGLGLAILMYFLNILSNIAQSVRFLKYVSPFGYCEGSSIMTEGALDGGKIAIGAAFCALGIAAAYCRYMRKDIKA